MRSRFPRFGSNADVPSCTLFRLRIIGTLLSSYDTYNRNSYFEYYRMALTFAGVNHNLFARMYRLRGFKFQAEPNAFPERVSELIPEFL